MGTFSPSYGILFRKFPAGSAFIPFPALRPLQPGLPQQRCARATLWGLFPHQGEEYRICHGCAHVLHKAVKDHGACDQGFGSLQHLPSPLASPRHSLTVLATPAQSQQGGGERLQQPRLRLCDKMPMVTDALPNSPDYQGVWKLSQVSQTTCGGGDLRQVESKEYGDGDLQRRPGRLCHSAVE